MFYILEVPCSIRRNVKCHPLKQSENAGLECSYYNTGNISHATLDGEEISNCKARKYRNCINKCWITEDGKVHVKYWGCEDFVETVKARIEAKLKEE